MIFARMEEDRSTDSYSIMLPLTQEGVPGDLKERLLQHCNEAPLGSVSCNRRAKKRKRGKISDDEEDEELLGDMSTVNAPSNFGGRKALVKQKSSSQAEITFENGNDPQVNLDPQNGQIPTTEYTNSQRNSTCEEKTEYYTTDDTYNDNGGPMPMGEFCGECTEEEDNDKKSCSILCCLCCIGGKCKCKCKCKKKDEEDDLYLKDDPLRKRLIRVCVTFIYVCLAAVAIFATYSMIQDLITSMNNPVRSVHYKKVKDYEAPGIAVYPGGAKFKACGHYYNNVVTSKVRLTQLDLLNLNCSYKQLLYTDPHYPDVERDVLVVRGPTSFETREAIFLHFELEDITRDFFTVSYFVFPGWDRFNSSPIEVQVDKILDYHTYVPTFALSAGLRMWIKLIMSETYFMDDSNHTEFKVEYSVVKYWDQRPEEYRDKHLFFIFFEWKNNIIEQSYLIYTTTPWSIGAGLCGVFLTLHRGYVLAQTSYKRVQKDKRRRSVRRATIREMKRQRSLADSQSGGN